MKKVIVITLVLKCFLTDLSVGQSRLDSLVRVYTYTLEAKNGALAGTAIDALKQASANAQFVLLGEEHNSKVIPGITAMLFDWLQREYDFQYVATEQDPVMMEMISKRPPKRLAEYHDLAIQYPLGFTFISDQELSMLQRICSVSSGRHDAIWGCEQAFGMTHIVDRLISTPHLSAKQNSFLLRLRAYTSPHEQKRDLRKFHLMSFPDKYPYVDTLKRFFRLSSDRQARLYVEALSMSDSIYRLFHQSKASPESRYWNNYVREEYMEKTFIRHYELAQTKDGKLPKVLFKFGHLHLYHGRNPNFIFTLGNFVTELASRNGKQTISIFAAYNPSEEIASTEHFLPLAKHASSGAWTLVDLRPLRPYFRAGMLETNLTTTAQKAFESIIFGFDFLLLVGDREKATFSVAQTEY